MRCVSVEELLFLVVFPFVDTMFVFQFANNSHGVCIITLFVVLFDSYFAQLLVRCVTLFVYGPCFSVCVLLPIRYVFDVCCLFLCHNGVLCCVPVEHLLFVILDPSYPYDVCSFNLQTKTTSFVSLSCS